MTAASTIRRALSLSFAAALIGGIALALAVKRAQPVALFQIRPDSPLDKTGMDALRTALERRLATAESFLRTGEWTIDETDGSFALRIRGCRDLAVLIAFLRAPGRIAFLPGRRAEGAIPPKGFSNAPLKETRMDLSRIGRKTTRLLPLWVRPSEKVRLHDRVQTDYSETGLFREPLLTLVLKPRDAVAVQHLSERHRGELLVLEVDGQVRAAAAIPEPLRGDTIQLKGMRHKRSVRELEAILSAGPLPVSIRAEGKKGGSPFRE